jgi:hypothetical protein
MERMRRTATANILLCCLLVGDALFIGADILQRRHMLHDVRFLITHDRGYGELFQYCKAGLGCLLLLHRAVQRASLASLTWSGLLALVLLDDSLQLHERSGDFLAVALRLPAIGTLRGNQLGELIFYAAVGIVSLAAVAVAWRHADAADRALSRSLLAWFVALAFCAVVLDAVDSLMRKTPWAVDFALLEDGGEMIVLSFLTACVWTAFERSRVDRRSIPAC